MHKIVIACELARNFVVLVAIAVAFSNSRNFNRYFENRKRNISLIVFTYIWFISIAFIDLTKRRWLLWSSETFYAFLALLGMTFLLFFVVNFVIKNVKKASATLFLWAMFIAYLTTNYFGIDTNWNLLSNQLLFTFLFILYLPVFYFLFVFQDEHQTSYEHLMDYLAHKLIELIELKVIQLILVIFTSSCMPYFYFHSSNEKKRQFYLIAIGSYFLFSIIVDLLIRKVIKSKLSLENWAQKHGLVIAAEELTTIQLDWSMPDSILQIITLLSCQLIIYYFLLINGIWDYFFCLLNMTLLVSTLLILNRNKWLKFTRKYNYIQNENALDHSESYIKTIQCSFFCSAYQSRSKKEVQSTLFNPYRFRCFNTRYGLDFTVN